MLLVGYRKYLHGHDHRNGAKMSMSSAKVKFISRNAFGSSSFILVMKSDFSAT